MPNPLRGHYHGQFTSVRPMSPRMRSFSAAPESGDYHAPGRRSPLPRCRRHLASPDRTGRVELGRFAGARARRANVNKHERKIARRHDFDDVSCARHIPSQDAPAATASGVTTAEPGRQDFEKRMLRARGRRCYTDDCPSKPARHPRAAFRRQCGLMLLHHARSARRYQAALARLRRLLRDYIYLALSAGRA